MLTSVSETTYDTLKTAYEKLMDKYAYMVEENDIQRVSIQELSKENNRLQTELNETYIDESGTVWIRPTAEAYYRVCKALEKMHGKNKSA